MKLSGNWGKKMIDANIKESFYKTFDLPNDKEDSSLAVTSDKILQIMAKICWDFTCTGNDFDPYEVSTADELADAILEQAIEMSKNSDYIYCSVREIFGATDEEYV